MAWRRSLARSRSLAWQSSLAAALAVLAVAGAGAEPRAVPLIYLAAVTPALCAADLFERRLPNRLVLPGYLVGIAGAGGQWAVFGEAPVLSLVAAVAYFVFLLALSLAGGMGMGDVKLAGVLGLAAGLVGPTAAVASPVAAFIVGGVAGIAALRGGWRASIPFGPFMLAGLWTAIALSLPG